MYIVDHIIIFFDVCFRGVVVNLGPNVSHFVVAFISLRASTHRDNNNNITTAITA